VRRRFDDVAVDRDDVDDRRRLLTDDHDFDFEFEFDFDVELLALLVVVVEPVASGSTHTRPHTLQHA